MFHITYKDAKDKAISELVSRQQILVKNAKDEIEFFFNNIDQFLTQLSKIDTVIDFDDTGRNEIDIALISGQR